MVPWFLIVVIFFNTNTVLDAEVLAHALLNGFLDLLEAKVE